MARVGITADQVAATADAIKARGQTPTIAAIRAELGTGSFTTIAQFLAKWKTEGAARADEDVPLPEAVENAALQAISSIWKIACSQAGEDVRALKAAHEEEMRAMAVQLSEAHKEIAELESINKALDAEIHDAQKTATASANAEMRLTGEVQALHRAIELLKQPAAPNRKASDTKRAPTKAPGA